MAELRGGVAGYYELDALDSVTSLAATNGFAAQTYTYDSFGNLTASNGTVINPFQYTGREFDPETTLYFYRARYYDSTIGRFLSEDPLRFVAGTNILEDPFHFKAGTDFYGYTFNSPTQWRDPDGRKIEWGDVANIFSWIKCLVFGSYAVPTVPQTSQGIGGMSADAQLNTFIANQQTDHPTSQFGTAQNTQLGCRENRNLIPTYQDCGLAGVTTGVIPVK